MIQHEIRRFKCAILHFGGDKTGSTSIQSACNGSREILYQNGIYYPEGQWHAVLGSCFSERPEKYIINVYAGNKNHDWIRQRDAQYLKKLREELADKSGDFLIFSYEGFPSLSEKELQRLKSFVLEYAEEYRIIYYVRAPESYAVSAMSQRVKMGIHAWPQDNPPITKYAVILQRMRSVFDKKHINIRVFDKEALLGGNVVSDFFALLDLSPEISQQIVANILIENTSLSMEALQIGEKIIDSISSLRLTENIFFLLYANTLSQIQGQKIQLTDQQAKEIAIASQPHTEYLRNEFDIIFPEPLKNDNNINKESLSHQTITSIAELFVKFVPPEAVIQNAKGAIRIIEPLDTLISSSKVSIPVQIFNNTENEWRRSNLYPIAMSYHWLDSKGQIVVFNGVRSPIPCEKILAQQTISAVMTVVAPDIPGHYKLVLTMLQERVRWFEDAEFEPCMINICVKPGIE